MTDDSNKTELPDTLSLPLRKPLTIGNETYDTLELREPNAGEFKKFTKLASTDPGAALVALIAMVTGLPPPIVDRIGVRDMNAAGEYLMGFIQPARPTATS